MALSIRDGLQVRIFLCTKIVPDVILSRFPKGITSGVKSIRKRVIGQGEFSLYQVMSSEYDLTEAVNRFRFALIPHVILVYLLITVIFT